MTATRSRLGGGERQEAVADTPMECKVVFGLEAGHVPGRLAGEAGLDRQVEDDREIRMQPVGRSVGQSAEVLETTPAP